MGRSVFDGVSDGSWAVFAEKAVAARDAAIEAAVKAKAEMQAELDLARSLHDVAVRQRDAANFLLEQVTREREDARVEVARLRRALENYRKSFDVTPYAQWSTAQHAVDAALSHPANCAIYDHRCCTCGARK